MNRARAAVLSAVLCDPTSSLRSALRTLAVDDAWDCIVHGHPSVPAAIRERIQAIDPEAFLARGLAAGARLITSDDSDWPSQLDPLGAARPWAIWISGGAASSVLGARSVAMVGARACTSYGERVAGEFAHGIASHGVPVVSGGAYGIDAAAHRGALAADGVTIAVLACGIDCVYPAQNAALFERIRERGLLVSEVAPGAHPTKQAFLVRNRIIAALTYGTVVVEARQRSGSISTYAHARACDRILMAVPGPITSPESAGTNALLRDDAQVVTSADEVLSLVLPVGAVLPAMSESPQGEWDALLPEERHIYECMPTRNPIAVSALEGREPAFLSGMALFAALAALAERGLIVELPDGRWRRARALRGAVA